MKTKGGHCRYVEIIEGKYYSIVYKAKKKLPSCASLEILECETYVDPDGLYNEEINPERK